MASDVCIYFDGPTHQLKRMSPHLLISIPRGKSWSSRKEQGEIVVEGKVTEVGPGATMYCAAGRLHGIKNTGTQPLLFYSYKWQA